MDAFSKKMKILKDLDGETDWEAAIKKETMQKKITNVAVVKGSSLKLTKSQKKKRKLERQQQQVQESLKAKNIETIVYNNPDAISKKHNKQFSSTDQSDAIDSTSNDAGNSGIDINMRKTRFEIMKFGMNSLKAGDKEDAETSLALSLGAKPKKKPAINYKDLQAQRKRERAAAEEEANNSMKPKLQMAMKKKPAPRKGSKRDKGKKEARGHANVSRNRNTRK